MLLIIHDGIYAIYCLANPFFNGWILWILFYHFGLLDDGVAFCSYVVDAADYENMSVSKCELHDLLSKSSLNGIPLLVLGNKIDKPDALPEDDLTERM